MASLSPPQSSSYRWLSPQPRLILKELTGTRCRLRDSFKSLHLLHLHTSPLETGPSNPKSLQIPTSSWLYNFVILAGNQRYTKSNLSNTAKSGRNVGEPRAWKWFYLFIFISLPSSPAFQAETSLLFPELFIRASEVFLWLTPMFQGAIWLLCKIPFSVLLKLIQSGFTHTLWKPLCRSLNPRGDVFWAIAWSKGSGYGKKDEFHV